jgi:hypothetical protein
MAGAINVEEGYHPDFLEKCVGYASYLCAPKLAIVFLGVARSAPEADLVSMLRGTEL